MYKYFWWNKVYMEGKPVLHFLYEYQLSIYLSVDSVLE